MLTRENKKMGSRSGLIALMFILTGWTLNTSAQETACSNAEQGTSYYFVNGILTDFVGAVLSTQHLSRELDAEGMLGPSDRVSLSYNDTGFPIPLPVPPGTPQEYEDLFYDLVESLAMDIQTNIGPGFNELGETAVELAVRELLSRADVPFLDDQAVQDRVIEALSRFVRDLIGDDQVDLHVARYRSDIIAGEKVVLLAYSQGNFFANRAFGLLSLEEQASLGIVSVANPDGQVALNECTVAEPGTVSAVEVDRCSAVGTESAWLVCPNGLPDYTTVCRDVVVNRLRDAYGYLGISSRALPPNFLGPGGLEEDDRWWHSFQDVYLRASSPTRTRILNITRDTEAGLLTPVIGGDLNLYGAVLSDENLALIGGARVKVELIADALGGSSGLYDAVIDDYTNQEGAYSLCIPSNDMPENILVSASADRFIPQVQSVPNPGPGELEIDFRLGDLGANTVVIEIDPIIHHLGDDNAGGAINSQFQKLSEGLVYETSFFLSEEQRSIQAATLQLYARGLQAENPLTINGEIVTFLNTSPADGSLGSIEVQVPISALDLESGVQILRIESEIGGVLFSDRDDFEFVNIIVSLTL